MVKELITNFKNKNIFVIGDSIVDVYVYGHALGISSETPTVVARRLGQKVSLGGAALVVRNFLELGAKVTFVTVVGYDEESKWVLTDFTHPNLTLIPFVDESRCTTVKKRYWIDSQKLLQFDTMDNHYIRETLENHIYMTGVIHPLNRNPLPDAIVISDYRHGLMSPTLIQRILGIKKIPIYVDSQISQSKGNHLSYAGAEVITLNLREARDLYPTFNPGQLLDLGILGGILKSDYVIVKNGKDGCLGMAGFRNFYSVPPLKGIHALDTCGAGDAFLAALVLGDIKSHPLDTLRIANAWAGLSTTIHGTEPPKFEQLDALGHFDVLEKE